MGKLFVVRHGESEANILHEFSNTGVKHPLTERGFSQARALASNLQLRKFDCIYSSPLLRARQTAEVIATELKSTVTIDDGLREFDTGELEGKSDPQSWDAFAKLLHKWIELGQTMARLPGGESLDELTARFSPVICNLAERASRQRTDIMLVTHGGNMRAVLPRICENLQFRYTEKHLPDHANPVILTLRDHSLICESWCGQAPDRGARHV